MSDAWWDAEYNKQFDLKEEIKDLCKMKNIKIPVFKEYVRSWELKNILNEIKSK